MIKHWAVRSPRSPGLELALKWGQLCETEAFTCEVYTNPEEFTSELNGIIGHLVDAESIQLVDRRKKLGNLVPEGGVKIAQTVY